MKNLIWLLPIIYFGITWFFPWEKFQWHSTISVSYLFDLLFIVLTCFYYKSFLHFKGFDWKGGISRVIATSIIAVISIFLISSLQIKAPFKYIEHLFIQVLILAPIVEELVFRHAFFIGFNKYFKNKNYLLLTIALMFSLSHLPAIFTLPAEYHSFIYAQLIYTFFLGWLCSKARLRTGNIVEPMLLHLIFNIIFYLAVIRNVI